MQIKGAKVRTDDDPPDMKAALGTFDFLMDASKSLSEEDTVVLKDKTGQHSSSRRHVLLFPLPSLTNRKVGQIMASNFSPPQRPLLYCFDRWASWP